MDNFSNTPERRPIQDVSAVNSFLTKTYIIMAVAVLVSALTSFLSTTVFRASLIHLFSNQASSWIIILLPFVLSLFISFRATRNPVASFILLMVVAVAYGLTFAVICSVYTTGTVTSAFVSAAAVFITMAIYGTVTKRDLSNIGSYATAALIGFIVATIINMFLKNPMITYIFAYIGVIIFVALTASDAQQIKKVYAQYADQTSSLGLAVLGALQLYLDFINIFMFFLEIFGMGSDNR
ncbi:Bax inhibitor-1/YccA family protein [Lactobacillus sp. PV037]|uniref:Bax inhibitor-1/YccA family protein n=1 Tax=unclassified Lactobacillus TaxID=2620435 RepID=UPI00223F6090|nr:MULTISPECIES: Bax inhibitor-1/YccA family protein [unclassified Lactobacillus]QNQ82665.1 Bax inhibitor-1/YccA family protein [Lactobacillus sp. PV012]QNQ83218.1 Bax inhibitor-1/YccA family protein [Lactobacillus sp. PV037]